jgi:hypothetical protein
MITLHCHHCQSLMKSEVNKTIQQICFRCPNEECDCSNMDNLKLQLPSLELVTYQLSFGHYALDGFKYKNTTYLYNDQASNVLQVKLMEVPFIPLPLQNYSQYAQEIINKLLKLKAFI